MVGVRRANAIRRQDPWKGVGHQEDKQDHAKMFCSLRISVQQLNFKKETCTTNDDKIYNEYHDSIV